MPLSEHQLLVFWVQLVVLLAVARGLGGVMRHYGQPAVIGELAAGLVVGPSLLGRLAPDVHAWLFPADPVQSGLLLAVAWVGVALLLVVTGFETDLELLAHLGRQAASVATGSLVVPLLMGFALGWLMPAMFVGAAGDRTSFALFLAVALSISALPVIAKILIDLGLMRRNIGQVTVAAGMANDLVGWLLLGTIAGVVASGSFDPVALLWTVVAIAVFLVLTVTVGQRLVDRALRAARQGERGIVRSFSVVVLVMLAAGAITQAIGVEAVLGAFVAGVVIGRSRYQRPEVSRLLATVTNGFLAPLFFATAGLFVDLGLLADPTTALWAVAVVAVAAVAKLLGSYAGARLGRLGTREGLAIGVGLNARGALEIIVATVGLGLGVLNASSYTIVVVMAMATSMMAPPLLRLALRGIEAGPDEAARLQREATMQRSVIAGVRSALLPTRGGMNSILAARILDLALQPGTVVTVFTVHDGDEALRGAADAAAREVAERFVDRPTEHSDRTADDPVEAICREATLGHGLIAVGMTEGALTARGPSPLLQRLVSESPVPILLVRHGIHLDTHTPVLGFDRILVAASGSRPARAAQEIAYTVGRRLGAPVDAVHVVNRPDHGESMLYVDGVLQPVGAAAGTLNEAVELARQFGTHVTPHTRTGLAVGPEIAAAAEQLGADLIVIGARLRSYEGEQFLGHGVEYLLDAAPQTVVVLVMPATDGAPAAGD